MQGELLYEGKAKKVYQHPTQDDQVILSYKDDATAFNGQKKEQFQGKGTLNNKISSYFLSLLNEQGIPTHFIEQINATDQLVYKSSVIPAEVVVRNIAAGSLTKRLGFKEKTVLTPPIVELYYKNDDLGDPLMNDEHALHLTGESAETLQQIKQIALQINKILQKQLLEKELILADFKLEFGRLTYNNDLVLVDEISPDTCRLWDEKTGEKLDKDVFREGTNDLITVYGEIWRRLGEASCTK
ncbi:phosphoribosylaminoimidazolesuccinocarboxamide synthase [Bacillaceae bacterium S4-13-56]